MDKDVCRGESLRKGQLKSVCRVSDSHTHTGLVGKLDLRELQEKWHTKTAQ